STKQQNTGNLSSAPPKNGERKPLQMPSSSAFQPVSPDRVSDLMNRELATFEAAHPRSREIHEQADQALLSGVPMNWMTRWPGSHPVFFEEANGNRLTDVDGNRMIDFCLGDTGAMTGHSPEPTVAAATRRLARGVTTMLPSP